MIKIFTVTTLMLFSTLSFAEEVVPKPQASRTISAPTYQGVAFYGCSSLLNFSTCQAQAVKVCQFAGYNTATSYKTGAFHWLGTTLTFLEGTPIKPIIRPWVDGYSDSAAVSFTEIVCE